MNDYIPMPIPVVNLKLNTENPRLEPVASQRQAMQSMFDSQKEKLINLAEDIVNSGMNPSDLTIVVPDVQDSGKYVVLDGNRRVTALKILGNPDLIACKNKTMAKKIRDLSQRFKQNEIIEMRSVLIENEDEAFRWVELKHTGENEGVGTVRWDALQKERFVAFIKGKSSIALQAIEFVRNSPDFDPELKTRLNCVPATNLTRLLEDSAVQEVLGISIQEGKIQTDLDQREVVKGLSKIIRDLADKQIKVGDIYRKKNRKDYIETFTKDNIPDKSRRVKPWQLNAPTPEPGSQKIDLPRKRSVRLSINRPTIIPTDCIIKIHLTRLNKIYRELKDLQVDTFMNAGAVLLRVFIELSLDTFIEKKKLQGVKKDDALHAKADKVADFMENSNLLGKHALKAIRSSVREKNSKLAIDTLHSYVHNMHLSPSAKDIKIAWDNYQLFMETLWENIGK